jgi:hypothetical protein
MRLPVWAEWFVVVFMSLAAAWIAAAIHSTYVFWMGHDSYNAEIGGYYFGSMGYVQPSLLEILAWILRRNFPVIPTFLLLLPFRKRPPLFWLVWIGCIVLSTWLFFAAEIKLH